MNRKVLNKYNNNNNNNNNNKTLNICNKQMLVNYYYNINQLRFHKILLKNVRKLNF